VRGEGGGVGCVGWEGEGREVVVVGGAEEEYAFTNSPLVNDGLIQGRRKGKGGPDAFEMSQLLYAYAAQGPE
jgi:hypothetical protein